MSESITRANNLNRVKDLLEKYDFDIKEFICGDNGRLHELYKLEHDEEEDRPTIGNTENKMPLLNDKEERIDIKDEVREPIPDDPLCSYTNFTNDILYLSELHFH